jgi:hypothetical protein
MEAAFASSTMATPDWAISSKTHGWHSTSESGWIFSSVHGYQYIMGVDHDRFWAYDVNIGEFLFFDNSISPHIYFAGEPSGYLYMLDESILGNRQFIDLRTGTGETITEGDL